MTDKIFGTAINCIDGRAQGPVSAWVKANFGVDFVDTITSAGVDKDVTVAKNGVEISVKAHGSRIIVVAGHYDCAGNPVSEEEHKMMIKKGVEAVKSWGLGAEVKGIWVNSNWEIEPVV